MSFRFPATGQRRLSSCGHFKRRADLSCPRATRQIGAPGCGAHFLPDPAPMIAGARLSCPRATEQAARACSEPMVAPYGDVVNCSLTKNSLRLRENRALLCNQRIFGRTAQVSADAGTANANIDYASGEQSRRFAGAYQCGSGRAIHAPSCPATAGFPPCGTKDHSSIFPFRSRQVHWHPRRVFASTRSGREGASRSTK